MILLTRKLLDSLQIADKLTTVGFNSFIEPMINISYLDYNMDISKISALIFTSINALKVFENDFSLIKDKKFFIVGKNTAKYVDKLGGKNIHIESNAEKLAILIAKIAKKEIIYYPRANIIAYELYQVLKKQGFNITQEIVYNIHYKEYISQQLKEYLLGQQIKQAIFYSKYILEHFLSLLDAKLKKTIIETKFIVPLNCQITNLDLKHINIKRFRPDEFDSLLAAIR